MEIDKLVIDGRTRTMERPDAYIIAEAGVNHEGSIEVAKLLIEQAKEGGADAIKFQSYKAETIASKDSPSYWDLNKEPTTSQYKLFKKYDSFWKDEFVKLAEYCRDVGIQFLSTPFDLESAEFLYELMPVYKISSSDLNNLPFIRHISNYGKPILLSTGASRLAEIKRSVTEITGLGVDVCLLHCVLNYPTDDKNANLAAISTLRTEFPELTVGYSDHTMPGDLKNLEVAYTLGAVVIEKHFTHDKTLRGNDHYHAMDLEDLKVLRKRLTRLKTILGHGDLKPEDCEMLARKNARRSLVAQRDIEAGQQLVAADITWKRPGTGIDPSIIDNVIGRRAKHKITEDSMIMWSDLDA